MDRSDEERGALSAILENWSEVARDGSGLTIAQLIEALNRCPGNLRAAILELCPGPDGQLPNSKSLGRRLARFNGRIINGKRLVCQRTRSGNTYRVLETSNATHSSGSGDSRGSSWDSPLAAGRGGAAPETLTTPTTPAKAALFVESEARRLIDQTLEDVSLEFTEEARCMGAPDAWKRLGDEIDRAFRAAT